MAEKTLVCRAEEVKPGSPHIVKIRSWSVGLFRIGDHIHALLNVCPHKGAPLCEGPQCGTTAPVADAEFIYHRDNEIVRCAWHGWEFDMRNGQSYFDPKRVKVRSYPVAVESGEELQKGPYVAETFSVQVEDSYVIIEV
jgi:nitrite reductase/ring-hydroxylating ferredoxin subunit